MKVTNTGIFRNRTALVVDRKKCLKHKNNRFALAKDDDELSDINAHSSEQLCTSSTVDSSSDQFISTQIYEQAKAKLSEIVSIQKKISELAKSRLTCFKDSQNNRYDESISKLAKKATDVSNFLMKTLIQAEHLLKKIKSLQTKTEKEAKFNNNLEFALAAQIQEMSRSLRQQEKQYFQTIRLYETSTTNSAIVLSASQRLKMTQTMSDEDMQVQMQSNGLQNGRVTELVQSINRLSGIYKEMHRLVIEQGSLVDRIDVNIESTFEHTQKAVIHLEGANQMAISGFADKVVKVLVVTILMLAVVLGLKYMH